MFTETVQPPQMYSTIWRATELIVVKAAVYTSVIVTVTPTQYTASLDSKSQCMSDPPAHSSS
ncbi:uncharacterized protein K460DRAFT_370593 [Cucurbitaria berberidis CBS 394.84]|uniref:Uncharacterized protein n=1 Tax=Cucurbitaria berberidis CBS 394.84 TaxID=1168544 RepID=A0A9P4GBR4_9PLEO|nr:uncharacterized protein K460DRAFT_370593 [Cucurbitaria berberidis CBS 394.84]KAF1842626.1 hypothetical protein K460DRAFT_370593 [Cucurbitaria berberidis CBS 394.84]